MLVIQRRKHLGMSSALGIKRELEQLDIPTHVVVSGVDSAYPTAIQHTDKVLRWGCRASLTDFGINGPVVVMNQANAIKRVNSKAGFLMELEQNERGLSPHTIASHSRSGLMAEARRLPSGVEYILRPPVHAQGRHVYKFSTLPEIEDVLNRKPRTFLHGGYIRPFIDKVKELRVYVVNGKVSVIANKTPANPEAIAWNVAQGGHFENVRWDDWHLGACELAIKVWKHTGLDISGIDIMIDRDDRAWLIEANSAPSLPFNSDGTNTIRHRNIAKAIAFRYNGGAFDLSGEGHQYDGWRRWIHPATWDNHALNNS